jgi:thiamine biosynthesis lipoprotein
MKADALATAVLVLGPEEGLSLMDRLEDVEGMIVTKEQEVIVSKGLDRYIS